VSLSRRSLFAALVSGCLAAQSNFAYAGLAEAATAVAPPVVAPVKKVDLRSLPVRAPAPVAVRHTYAHVTAAFQAPEPARLPPYRMHPDRDPLSLKLSGNNAPTPGIGRGATSGHTATPLATRRTASVSGSGPGVIGRYPWWTFEAHSSFAAMGNALANVVTGNVLLTSTDLAIPHFGLDLLVTRAYNSMSSYDVNTTDGSQPSVFGNGWTSNLDAHIALNGSGGLAIYDGTGARWDYSPNGSGGWTAPPGQYAILSYSSTNQEYYWTYKDGTVYQFRTPSGCSVAALCGRIHYIWARNNNEYLHFAYGFSSSDDAFAHLSSITVTTETGKQLYCFVNPINGHPLVTEITPYDTNTQVWQTPSSVLYSYDNSGNVVSYAGAPNSTGGSAPVVGYTYYSGGHQLYQATSPLYGNGHGAYIQFEYGSGGAVAEVDNYGEVDPTVADGVSTGPIQPGTSGVFRYNAVQYQYGVSGWTEVVDSDGHQRRYHVNTDGTIATKTVYTGSAWLSTSKYWDANHNVTAVVDARNARTDFVLDSQGNVTVEAQPSVAVYAGGAHSTTMMRPTIRAVYDAYSNILAICGAAWNHAHSSDYGGSNNCAPGASGVTTFAYQTTTILEPNGRLTSMTDPNNYHYTWTYAASSQPGGFDYSLPTQVQGDAFNQDTNPNGGWITPNRTMSYDAYGNLICYNDGRGVTALSYDAMNRLTEKSDPDDNLAACGRTPGQYQTALYKTYYPNGQVKTTGTALAHAQGQDDAYTYDLDGNQSSLTNYENGNANLTNYYFDGGDRLGEVAVPHDPTDYLATRWLTRYVYDISAGGAQSEAGITGSFHAFGNVFKVEEYQPSGFVDLQVAAYDEADRRFALYARVPGKGSSYWRSETTSYDTAGAGRIASRSDSGGNSETFAYDAVGRVSSLQFTSSQTATPSRTYGYDEEGRAVLTQSGTWGSEWQSYDPYTGRVLSTSEANQGGLTSPGTFSYTYYPNGWARSTSFAGAAMNGTLHDQWYNANGTSAGKRLYNGSGVMLSTVSATSTPGGRLLTQRDSSASNARTVTLDSYGRPQSVSMPAGAYSTVTHDINGNVTGFAAMSNHTVASSFNARNELVSSIWSKSGTFDKNYPNVEQHGENGQMNHDQYYCDTSVSPPSCSWISNHDAVDLVGGAITSSGSDYYASFTYDSIGRLTTNTQAFPGVKFPYTGTATKTYDAENRLTSDGYSNWSASVAGICGAKSLSTVRASFALSYSWGAHGHPVQFSDSSLGTTETLHWDGEELAFTTNSAGQLDDLKYAGLADYTPRDSTYAGITFWDRDLSGAITSSHNATGHGTWTASDVNHNGCVEADAPGDSAGFAGPSSFGWVSGQAYRYRYNGLLLNYTSDGFTDGFNNTNGVRTLSNSSAQWATPDAFGGVPTAPQSQKSYVYAANNPASEDDPSGYLTQGQQNQLGQYFSNYNWSQGPVACTTFMVNAYSQALGINLQQLVSQDYFGNNPLGPVSILFKGYDLHGFNSGHPELWVPNLHNYFEREGEITNWTGNTGMQVGDILFVGPRLGANPNPDGPSDFGIDIDHVAVVEQVGKNGAILTIVEGTGEDAKVRSWQEFVAAMADQGLAIQDYARLQSQFAALAVQLGANAAAVFMSGDDPYGWLDPNSGGNQYL